MSTWIAFIWDALGQKLNMINFFPTKPDDDGRPWIQPDDKPASVLSFPDYAGPAVRDNLASHSGLRERDI